MLLLSNGSAVEQSDGFTIIELLAALAIIAALVVIAIPAYQSYQNKARAAEATHFLSSAQVAEKSFYQAERSYTACLPAIMGVDLGQSRYYAIGFNLQNPTVSLATACGPSGGQSCLQKCFSNPASCSSTNMICNYDSTTSGVAFPSTALSTNIDFYGANTPGAYYLSVVSTKNFEVVAATDESQLSKNDFLDKVYPSAYAANWKVYAIGPSGGPYVKGCSSQCDCDCHIIGSSHFITPKIYTDGPPPCYGECNGVCSVAPGFTGQSITSQVISCSP